MYSRVAKYIVYLTQDCICPFPGTFKHMVDVTLMTFKGGELVWKAGDTDDHRQYRKYSWSDIGYVTSAVYRPLLFRTTWESDFPMKYHSQSV